MSYIILQDGKVGVTDEGLSLPVVDAMLKSFEGNEEGFVEAIRYIYYFANSNGPYTNFTESERHVRLKAEQFNYLSNDEYDAMVKNEYVVAVADHFKDTTYDVLDRAWDGALKRVDNFLKHLNDIPMTFTKSVDVYDEEEGKKVRRRVEVEVSNHDEYWKALKTYNEVIKFVRQVEEDIRNDVKEGRRRDVRRRMFDTAESLRVRKGEPRILN